MQQKQVGKELRRKGWNTERRSTPENILKEFSQEEGNEDSNEKEEKWNEVRNKKKGARRDEKRTRIVREMGRQDKARAEGKERGALKGESMVIDESGEEVSDNKTKADEGEERLSKKEIKSTAEGKIEIQAKRGEKENR